MDPHKDPEKYQRLRETLLNLIAYRREILAGDLPIDKLNDLKYALECSTPVRTNMIGVVASL